MFNIVEIFLTSLPETLAGTPCERQTCHRRLRSRTTTVRAATRSQQAAHTGARWCGGGPPSSLDLCAVFDRAPPTAPERGRTDGIPPPHFQHPPYTNLSRFLSCFWTPFAAETFPGVFPLRTLRDSGVFHRYSWGEERDELLREDSHGAPNAFLPFWGCRRTQNVKIPW